MSRLTVKLETSSEAKRVISDLKELGKGIPLSVKRNAAFAGGVPVRSATKALAPVGKTGGLKRSVTLRRFKKKGESHAFVAFDKKKLGLDWKGTPRPANIPIWINQGTKAHGPFVSTGGQQRHKHLKFIGRGGKFYQMKRVKGVTKTAFLEHAIARQATRAMKIMNQHVIRYINRKYKFKIT